MHPQYETADALTAEVIDAAVRVQRHFGIGLMESIYQKCLAHELRLAGHLVETEKPVAITYRGLELEENLRLDILVDGCLVVECKSLDEDKVNMPRHKAQLLSYMRLLNAPLGLVVNFGDSRLGSRGIARVILKGASSPDIAAP
jgi:GxxExxY protein